MNLAELFDQQTDTVQLAPGEFLFREGDNEDKMYVLLDGEMEIRLGSYVVETAEEGALIGALSLIERSPRPADALAKTASRLAPISEQRFDFLVQQYPRFARHVMKELAARLRHTTAAAELLLVSSARAARTAD